MSLFTRVAHSSTLSTTYAPREESSPLQPRVRPRTAAAGTQDTQHQTRGQKSSQRSRCCSPISPAAFWAAVTTAQPPAPPVQAPQRSPYLHPAASAAAKDPQKQSKTQAGCTHKEAVGMGHTCGDEVHLWRWDTPVGMGHIHGDGVHMACSGSWTRLLL